MLKVTSDTTDRRPLVMAAIMAAMFMVAIEATIVSTAMPQIAGQLGDLQLLRLGLLRLPPHPDRDHGRLRQARRHSTAASPSSSSASPSSSPAPLLCGFATTMAHPHRSTASSRASAPAPSSPSASPSSATSTRLEERGRVQGWLASVWGISSVLGPLAGGLIIQQRELGLDLLDQRPHRPRRRRPVHRASLTRTSARSQGARSTSPAPPSSPSPSPPSWSPSPSSGPRVRNALAALAAAICVVSTVLFACPGTPGRLTPWSPSPSGPAAPSPPPTSPPSSPA